ncbi:MAG TPA: alpha/beta fold hydrolase [Pseudonocardia sp.]|nr:alpha/beta fold hydrolase [Pseudonocardia sp.]
MPSVLARLRVTRRRVVALLVVFGILVLAGVAGVLGTARSGSVQPRIEEFQLSVPGGPGQPGPVTLDAAIYLPARTPAPAVLVAHGFGGSKASVDADARDLAGRGFVALAWSARGFGRSTGQIALDSPDYEVADASRLIDYLATRPEVRLDAPGDPRVGVTGGSYGGALALLLAGYDHRVDAIAPAITWNDLGQALFPNSASASPPPADTPAHGAFGQDGVFKRGWAGIFFAAGLNPGTGRPATPLPATPPADDTPASSDVEAPSTAAAPSAGPSGGGSADSSGGGSGGGASTGGPPAGDPGQPALGPTVAPPVPTSCGRFVPAICQAYAESATTGRASQATTDLLRRSSPASVAGRITAPTLLVQGETDTLFGLDQADATARQIAAGGGTVSVIWYSGGHDGGAPGPTVRARVAAWFDRYLGTPPGASPAADDDVPPVGGLNYAVQGGVRGGRGTPTVRTVTAERYPGLAGAPAVRLDQVPLHGAAQDVLNPPGGTPAALTAVPGIGGALGSLAGRLAAIGSALPGQSASFIGDPVPSQVLVAGAPRVRLRVAPVPGQPTAAEAVLFGSVLDLGPDGRRTLLGGAVAPMRIPLPAGGGPAEVTVTLPAVVAPIAAGHRLAVAVSTTDQAYQGDTATAVWQVELVAQPGAPSAPGAPGASGAEPGLAVPVVPGRSVTANTVPTGPAVGIALVVAAALVAGAVGWLLRRRRERTPPTPAPATGNGTGDGAGDGHDVPPLVIEDLRKSYPGGITAVAGVSFTVRRNQVFGLLGPNGAGKTTVLRMLMGLIHPTSGTMRVFGHRVAPGAEVLSRVGSFVEGPGLLPHLSGAANLRLYWASTGRPEAQARLAEALEIAGLGTALDRAVRTYSHGMRQRLAIAQAMLGLPDLLVLDEPTNGLDPPQILAMREVLRRYAEGGRTVLVSSHLLAEVEQTCDHVVVMHRGAVVADGSVAELVAGGGQASFRVDDPAKAAALLAGLTGISAVQVDGDAVHADLNGTPRAEVVGELVRAGVAVETAGPRRRLEDAFMQLVGEERHP